MKCPHCEHLDNRVLETRLQREGEIRRRRECLKCKGRFSTLETIVRSYPYVLKKDGRRELFSKDKLRRGLQLACLKRPVSLAQIEHIVSKISKMVLDPNDKEITALTIGHALIKELRELDDVAYIRFASVYRTFKDVNEFVQSLEDEVASKTQKLGPELEGN